MNRDFSDATPAKSEVKSGSDFCSRDKRRRGASASAKLATCHNLKLLHFLETRGGRAYQGIESETS